MNRLVTAKWNETCQRLSPSPAMKSLQSLAERLLIRGLLFDLILLAILSILGPRTTRKAIDQAETAASSGGAS